MCTGQILTYPARSPDKVYGIVIMFVHTRSYGKDVRVKNDIVRIETDFLNQKLIGTGANFNLTFISICLPFFIKSHHYGRCTISLNRAGMFQEFLFSLFQGDGIYNGFPLQTL